MAFNLLRTTSDVNISPTQPPDIKILFKRDSSYRAQTGLSAVGIRVPPVCYRINMSTKQLLKSRKLTFTII